MFPNWLPWYYLASDEDNYDIYTKMMHGTEVVVAIHKDLGSVRTIDGEKTPPRDEFVQFVFDTFGHHWGVFDGYPYDRYIVKVLPQDSYQKWLSSSAVGFTIVTNRNLTHIDWFTTCKSPCIAGYKQFVTHEMFHAWNGNVIIDFGGYINYIRPEVWFTEGATQYYGYRSNFKERDLYLGLMEHSWKMYQDWVGTEFDVPIVDLSERNVVTGKWQFDQMIREKGACLFYLIDLELVKLGMSLDDLMKHLYENYGLAGRRFVTEDIFTAINEITERDWSDFFEKYVYGTELLPLNGEFEYLVH